jgi:hypothetical protein
VVERLVIGAETVAEDLGHQRTHRFVTRPVRQSCDDLREVLLSPSAKHGGTISRFGSIIKGFPSLRSDPTIFCMSTYRSSRQPDLFEAPRSPRDGGNYAALLQEPPPADFIERIRNELTDTLARVRGAAALPWKDLTAATLAELRFNSITNWLPAAEAEILREAFGREMGRLWDIAARDADEAP